jgi:hypothetical protein
MGNHAGSIVDAVTTIGSLLQRMQKSRDSIVFAANRPFLENHALEHALPIVNIEQSVQRSFFTGSNVTLHVHLAPAPNAAVAVLRSQFGG